MKNEYFFISESKWREFTAKLTSGQYICENSQAMYGPLIVNGKSNPHSLYLLCKHLCKMVGQENVLNSFIKNELIFKRNFDSIENEYDIPNNDWKPVQ